MLKSCSYCGRIHDSKKSCRQKRDAEQERWNKRKATKALAFRRTNAWKDKSMEVRKRQHYMCVCCTHNLEGTTNMLNTKDLSVHHIVPVEENYDLRLDNENLITVCNMHHEMCEAGKIGRGIQKQIAREFLEENDEHTPALFL